MGAASAPTGTPSTEEREEAGSVVTRRVRDCSRAAMAAQVVLPTPPLPPTNCHLMFVAFEGRFDAGDLHVLRRNDARFPPALPLLDFADADQDVGFQGVE